MEIDKKNIKIYISQDKEGQRRDYGMLRQSNLEKIKT